MISKILPGVFPRLNRIITLVIMAGIILFAGCDMKEIKRDRFYNRGNLSLEKNEFAEAIRFYEEAVTVDPAFSKAWNNMGVAHKNQNRYKDAIISFDQAILHDPEMIQAYYNRADANIRIGRYSLALDDLEIVESNLKDTSAVHFLKGECFYYLGKYDSAINSFGEAMQDDPGNEEILINMAVIFLDLDSLTEVENWLKQAESLNSENANIHNVRSMLDLKRNDPEKALTHIETALTKDPGNAYFLNNKGFILLVMDRMQEALPLINRSIEKDPDNKWAYRNKGIYYFKSGQFNEAERLLKRAYDMDPDLEEINYYLGLLYLELDDPGLACKYFKSSADLGEIAGLNAISQYCQ
ncbi:MAG: tetratricopeptide repeat protein [Cyclobacteriaceae bacterium]|nr:tetratricopeptide repeat protein [Cyclobacteriaceae bacterium]